MVIHYQGLRPGSAGWCRVARALTLGFSPGVWGGGMSTAGSCRQLSGGAGIAAVPQGWLTDSARVMMGPHRILGRTIHARAALNGRVSTGRVTMGPHRSEGTFAVTGGRGWARRQALSAARLAADARSTSGAYDLHHRRLHRRHGLRRRYGQRSDGSEPQPAFQVAVVSINPAQPG